MTATQTTAPSIPRPSTPFKGKQSAQGLLSIAPTPRTDRARSDASQAAPSFADRLKEAKGAPALATESAGQDASPKTNVREDQPQPRENDAVSPSRPDETASRSEGQSVWADPPDDTNQAGTADSQVSDVKVKPTDPTTQTTALLPAEAPAEATSPAVTSVLAEAAASSPSADAKPSTEKVAKSTGRAAKATVDPLGLIPRESKPVQPGAREATPKNDAQAATVPAPQADAQGTADAASVEVQKPIVESEVPQTQTAQRDSQPAEGKPRESSHADQKVKHDASAMPAEQASLPSEPHGRDSGSILGMDLNSVKASGTTFGGGVKLAVQPRGLATDNGDAGAEALSMQAARGLAAAFKQKGGTVTLNLTPESLGQIKVKITVEEAKVSAMILTSTEQAKRMLESSGDALRSAMESKGLTVDRISVSHAPLAMSEARELGRGSASGEANQQNERGDRGGGHAGDSGGSGHQRSGDHDARQGWQHSAARSSDLFGLMAMSETDALGATDELGAPIAMATVTRAGPSREGIVRLSVDAMA